MRTDIARPAGRPFVGDVVGAWSASRLAWGFVLFGCIVRLINYATCPPLWVDECMLAENLLDRGFLQLARPLANHQVAPVGFLWVQLAAVKLLGFSEWSLRLFPLLCGMGSLFLFRHVASRLLSGAPFMLAVACLAVAKSSVGLSGDVKPYACDLAVALGILVFAVEWLRQPQHSRWLWCLAAVVPVALSLSFPAVFVAGAAGLGLWLPVWRQRSRAVWCAYLVSQLLLCAAFVGMLRLNGTPGSVGIKTFMDEYWTQAGGFPPLLDPGQLLVWLVDVHLGDRLFAIPYGAPNGGGAVCCLVSSVGALLMFRRGQRTLLTILAVPFALTLVASLYHRYPYGGHVRLMQYLVPAICLWTGMGTGALLERLPHHLPVRFANGLAVALVLFGVGQATRMVLVPWHFELDEQHREFARTFWQDDPHWITVCAQTDLGAVCCRQGWDAYYRCNQQIYSPPHHAGRRLSADSLTELLAPLRIVVFHPPYSEFNQAVLDESLVLLERDFEPAGHEVHVMPRKPDGFDLYGTYEVFRFVPRTPAIVSPEPMQIAKD